MPLALKTKHDISKFLPFTCFIWKQLADFFQLLGNFSSDSIIIRTSIRLMKHFSNHCLDCSHVLLLILSSRRLSLNMLRVRGNVPRRASLRACAPFCNRRGRETKTSSDASQEAPERARKDTPKEVKLQYEGSYPSVRLYKHSFSGFLATRPMSAGWRAAHSVIAPYRSPRGKSVSSVKAWLPTPLGRQYYTKNQAC